MMIAATINILPLLVLLTSLKSYGNLLIEPKLDGIPPELGLEIASYLSVPDLCSLKGTSRLLNSYALHCDKSFELNLSEKIIKDEQWIGLFNPRSIYRNLKRLNLARTSFSHQLLHLLPETLETLDLSSCGLDQNDLRKMSHLKNLKHLYLGYNLIDSAAIAVIAEQFPKLEVLTAEIKDRYSTGYRIGFEGASELGKLKNLVDLDLSGHPLLRDRPQGAPIPKLPPQLRALRASYCELSNSDIAQMSSHLTSLEVLDLRYNELNDEAIKGDHLFTWIVHSFPRLNSLYLTQERSHVFHSGNSIVKLLGDLKLNFLALPKVDPDLTPQIVALLRENKGLKFLTLPNLGFEVEDLKSLGETLTQLTRLNLSITSMSEEQIKQILPEFPSLSHFAFRLDVFNRDAVANILSLAPQLERVEMTENRISSEDQISLRAQFPKIQFHFSSNFED